MKKLLAFLILLGVGLLVLRWLDRDPATERPEEVPPVVEEQPADTAEEDGADETETDTETLPGQNPGKGLALGGAFRSTLFDKETGHAVLRFRSEDSNTTEGIDEFSVVDVELIDPRAEVVEAEMRAARGRVRRLLDAEKELGWVHQRRIELERVSVIIHSGAPLVPLRFEAPSAEASALESGPRTISSPDEVELVSPRLRARGNGFSLDLDRSLLTLDREGEIEFTGEPTVLGALSSEGSLVVLRETETTPPRLAILARGGATLDLPGASPARLEATTIALRAVEPADGSGGFTIVGIRAEGEVVWRSGNNVFRAEQARVEFDEEGRPLLATLEGFPSFRFSLAGEAGEIPGISEDELSRISGSGEGPLLLRLQEEGRRMELEGPATLDTPGGALRSGGAIHGWTREVDGERKVAFSAVGGVVLESASATLETAELEVELGSGEGGPTTLAAIASKGARLIGTLEGEREFTLTTPERLEVLRTGEHWLVVEVTRVVLSIDGPDGFTARADRVQGFDPEAQSFQAQGDVSFENTDGKATGEFISVRDPEHYVLLGSGDRKVVVEGSVGRIEAGRLEQTGAILRAHERVVATLDPSVAGESDERYELVCRDLECELGEASDQPGASRSDEFRFEAEGGVEATVVRGQETTKLTCRRLEGRRLRSVGSQDEVRLDTSHFVAEGAVESTLALEAGELEIASQRLELDRARGAGSAQTHWAKAQGEVRFEIRPREVEEAAPGDEAEEGARWIRLAGRGDLFLLDHLGNALLEPAPGERVVVRGTLPSHDAPFELTADNFLCRSGRILEADRPELQIARIDQAESLQPLVTSARRLVASEESLELTEDVRVHSTTPSGVPWKLRSGRVKFEGSAGSVGTDTALQALEASGGVEFEVGAREHEIDEKSIARASGETLEARSLLGVLRLSGAPARIASPVFVSEAEWIEFDPDLQIITATGKGRLLPAEERTEDVAELRWSLDYLSSSTLIDPDSLVFVMQEPTFRDNQVNGTVRSSWALCWIDRQRWMELPDRLAQGQLTAEDLRVTGGPPEPDVEAGERMTPLFGKIQTTDFAGLLREIYFEGPVEVLLEEDLIARADAIFLDVVDGHGWLAAATIHVYGHLLGERFEKLTVKADWLRHSRDGSLRADGATVTPCDYDKPHMRIVTGDLEIKPVGPKYRVNLRDNRIEFYDRVTLPLPELGFGLDEKGGLDLPSFKFGDSARFGKFLSGGIVKPAGKLGKGVNSAMRGNPVDYDADYSVHLSWLGSRGLLIDLGLELESKEDYWLDMHLGGLPDSGKDRGYVRVPENDRDDWRLWYRLRSRHNFDDEHWIDTALSHQTDAGVQSEFFESDFARFEQRETFVHWRLASGSDYYDATVKARTEDFRTDINELPSAGAYRGSWPLGSLGPFHFLHTGDVHADRLGRREGDPGRQSPYALPDTFADGRGNQDVLRVDTGQRIEAPVALGIAGLKATPFIGARFTAWDEGVAAGQSPTRFMADAGFRLAGTYWRRGGDGEVHQITPYVEYRDDIDYRQEDTPLRFDSVDDPKQGRHVTLGTRARFDVARGALPLLDLDLQATHASHLETGFVDRPLDRDFGWSGAVYALLSFEPWDVPVQVWHDGRYAFDRDEKTETVYSMTRAALRITEDLRFEGGHRRGLLSDVSRGLDPVDPGGPNARRSFETASIAGIYSWTSKWEFEGQQTFSLREDADLMTNLILRRFGHDIIFELESSVREGEGTSLSMSVRPRYGWKPSRLGHLNF